MVWTGCLRVSGRRSGSDRLPVVPSTAQAPSSSKNAGPSLRARAGTVNRPRPISQSDPQCFSHEDGCFRRQQYRRAASPNCCAGRYGKGSESELLRRTIWQRQRVRTAAPDDNGKGRTSELLRRTIMAKAARLNCCAGR